jgi:membrane AbrB-like protein
LTQPPATPQWSVVLTRPEPVRSRTSLPASIGAHLAQIAVAAFGGLILQLLGVPAAWLSGAVVATVLWTSTGYARRLPQPVVDGAMLISGASMGATITPEAIAAMARYPSSLLTLAAGVIVISGASALWLVRVSGWQRDDAVLASVPGALTTVLAVAADRNANVAAIAIVQSFRLFILIALLPSAVVLIEGAGPGTFLIGEGVEMASPTGLALTLSLGLALGLVLERLGVAAPILLGATISSTALHLTGAAPGGIPPLLATAGLVLVGVFIAERFRNLSRSALAKLVPAALGSLAVGLALAAAFSALAAWLADVAYADALVAFAPGGLEAMMVLALVLGLDPLYVGIHHLARFLGIGFVLPFLVAWLQKRS